MQRHAQGGWHEGRVVDGRMLVLDSRGGEDRVRRLCARVCEGTIYGEGRLRVRAIIRLDGGCLVEGGVARTACGYEGGRRRRRPVVEGRDGPVAVEGGRRPFFIERWAFPWRKEDGRVLAGRRTREGLKIVYPAFSFLFYTALRSE